MLGSHRKRFSLTLSLSPPASPTPRSPSPSPSPGPPSASMSTTSRSPLGASAQINAAWSRAGKLVKRSSSYVQRGENHRARSPLASPPSDGYFLSRSPLSAGSSRAGTPAEYFAVWEPPMEAAAVEPPADGEQTSPTPTAVEHSNAFAPRASHEDRISVISGFAPPPDVETARVARLAKLSRTLGEPITEEHLAGTPTPSPPARGSRRFGRRRLSLDMAALLSPTSPREGSATASGKTTTPGTGNSTDTASGPVTVKRTRSLWSRRLTSPAREAEDGFRSVPARIDENEWISGADQALRPTSPPLPERHRVLNVKRSRKMNDLFGCDPPALMLQMTTPAEAAEVLLSPITPRRASIATFSTEDGLGTPTIAMWASTPTSADAKRASVLTLISLAGSQASHRRHSSTASVESPRQPAPDSVRHLATALDVPPSPAPFAHFRPPPASSLPVPEVVPVRRASEGDGVWMRRRRAAKLSSFFGVATREIPALDGTPPVPEVPVRPDISAAFSSPEPARARSPMEGDEAEVSVDVKFGAVGRFWGLMPAREPDMNTAMAKLREMRAR